MRIRHKVIVKIADDADMKDLLFSTDETLAETIIDGYERQVSGKISITANTNEDVPLGDVDAVKGFYLKMNQDCTVKLNGGTEVIQLRKSGTTVSDYAKLFMEADVSQINITAPAAEDAIGIYCVWGDPTP